MPVDSFKYLPRSFRSAYEGIPDPPCQPVWAPLRVVLEEATVALPTSAGFYVRGEREPFDLERERREPMWGDPSFRLIPRTVRQDQIAAAHLHLNDRDALTDFDVALPISVLEDFVAEGRIGRVADYHYSVMGYQSRDLREWRETYGPEVVEHIKQGGVDALILAPA